MSTMLPTNGSCQLPVRSIIKPETTGLRMAANAEPEFIIPITTARWHGVAWDNGSLWMVTGSSDVDRYLEQDGKLTHTTTPGLVKYDAATAAACPNPSKEMIATTVNTISEVVAPA